MLGQNKVNQDDCALVPRNKKDEWGMVASNSKVDWGLAGSNAMDPWRISASNQMDLWGMGSSAMNHLGMVGSNSMDNCGMVAGDDRVIRGIPNLGLSCYMNASLQCLLALGKLRTMILSPAGCSVGGHWSAPEAVVCRDKQWKK
jgi:hypothetical protein